MDLRIDIPNNAKQFTPDSVESALEETSTSEPDNDSPAMCQILGDKLWALTTNPLGNSTMTFLWSGAAGVAGTTLAIENAFDGLDGCDTSNLGDFKLRIGLTVAFAVLSFASAGIGYLGAKQHYDHLLEAKNDASEALTFNTSPRSSINDDATVDKSSDDAVPGTCSISPNVALGISVGTILFGTFVGVFAELLYAPTQLGGSGCDLSPIKTGSKGMGISLGGLILLFFGAACLAYKYKANTNQIISETQALRSTRYFDEQETV